MFLFFVALSFPTIKRKRTPRQLFFTEEISHRSWIAATEDKASWMDEGMIYSTLRLATGTNSLVTGGLALRLQEMRSALSGINLPRPVVETIIGFTLILEFPNSYEPFRAPCFPTEPEVVRPSSFWPVLPWDGLPPRKSYNKEDNIERKWKISILIYNQILNIKTS